MLKIRHIITLLLIAFIYTQPGGGNWKPVGFVRGTIIDDLTEIPKEYASISIIAKETDGGGGGNKFSAQVGIRDLEKFELFFKDPKKILNNLN